VKCTARSEKGWLRQTAVILVAHSHRDGVTRTPRIRSVTSTASYIAVHPFSAALLEGCTPAFGNLVEAIKRQEISHDDDPGYAQQILNAIVRSNEPAFTLAKQKSPGKIDAACSLMTCFDRANVGQKPCSPLVVL
jgi:hypothetical protein